MTARLVEKEQSSTTGDGAARREARRCKTSTEESEITSNWGRDGVPKEERQMSAWGYKAVKIHLLFESLNVFPS